MATISKTAKASTVLSGKAGTVQDRVDSAKTAEAPRLLSLNQGKSCRFFDPVSQKSLNLRVGTEEFVEALRPSWEAGLGERLRKEMEGFIQNVPSSAPAWRNALNYLGEAGLN